MTKSTIRVLAAVGIAGGLLAWTAATPAHIVIIGDSTVMTYDSARYYPQAGWGQMLGYFFKRGAVTIDNKAIGGRSSRSFYEEGRWAGIVPTLKAGDFVFIQFGHNDRGPVADRHADTATFKMYLGKYVTESRAKGAIPVLVTPMNQNTWNGTTLTESFNIGANDYHGAMMHVATAMKVPLIDLEQASKNLFQPLGQDYLTRFLFLNVPAGAYPAFPSGHTDATHFQIMGALELAKCVAAGIGSSADSALQPLAQSLAPLYAFEPTLNKAGAATITQSSSYPTGVPLILRAYAKTGETFQGWKDASGKLLSTRTEYRMNMPAGPVKIWATFQGGTTGVHAQIFGSPRAAARAMDRDALGRIRGDPFPLYRSMVIF
jgi:lysophospholipase L1-like esterase